MKFISYDDAATNCCCHKDTIRRAVEKGYIDAYKPGKQVQLDADSVDKWFKSTKIKPKFRIVSSRQRVQISSARR